MYLAQEVSELQGADSWEVAVPYSFFPRHPLLASIRNRIEGYVDL